MKERPILFSAPMVNAILEGRKHQTRRAINPQPPEECGIHYMLGAESWLPEEKQTPLRHTWEAWHGPLFRNRPKRHLCGSHNAVCPYGKPGDRLWVRETWGIVSENGWANGPSTLNYRANGAQRLVDRDQAAGLHTKPELGHGKWRPSIHMPRWASRITLEIKDIRVERLQQISQNDAAAEGAVNDVKLGWRHDVTWFSHPRASFAHLWDSINAKKHPWQSNPWVWVVEFQQTPPSTRDK